MPMTPNANYATTGDASGAAARAARTNPELADALASIPEYVDAVKSHEHLLEQMKRVPDAPSDADVTAEVLALVDERRRLPRNLVNRVSENLAARGAYEHTRTLLSQALGGLVARRDAAITRQADTALAHLHSRLAVTMKQLTRLHALPETALAAMEAGKADAWHEREQHRTTLELLREAQRVICTVALGEGGTGLPDHIGMRWEHLAYTPSIERLWKTPDDLAHYLARGFRTDRQGNRRILHAPYPGPAASEHRAWAAHLIEHDAPAWVPSLSELEDRAAKLTTLAASTTSNQAPHKLSPSRQRRAG